MNIVFLEMFLKTAWLIPALLFGYVVAKLYDAIQSDHDEVPVAPPLKFI